MSAYHRWSKEYRGAVVEIDTLESSVATLSGIAGVEAVTDDGRILFRRVSDMFVDSASKYFLTEKIPVEFTSGETGLLAVTRMPGPFVRDEDRWYFPLAGLLFIGVMVILIVQSIRRSISNLEKATRKIAGGDLDFDLPMKGNDKLASLTKSFDSMRQHLKEEYARRARFIMGVSHDLKTPLASLTGYANAIREGYADTEEKLDRYAGVIEDKAKLLNSRISLLIDHVRRDTDEWKLDLHPVGVAGFFNEIARMFELEAALKDRTFHDEIEIREVITVALDEEMLIRAMENLMQNALSYSSEGGEIQLVGTEESGQVVISLANDGPGITSADLPHIFDPFVRGARDRKGSGLGLGLATVESIISSHGFSISVRSIPDATTEFTISMPISG